MLKLNKCLYKFASLLPAKVYVVGGFVRDSLLCKKALDVDVCSKIPVEKLKEFLQNSHFKIISSSLFQTAKIEYNNNGKIFNFEYSCFRKDYYNKENGHNPYKIRCVSNLKLDAKRRDFTINCIYFDIKNNKIVDPKNGLKHIKNKTNPNIADNIINK